MGCSTVGSGTSAMGSHASPHGDGHTMILSTTRSRTLYGLEAYKGQGVASAPMEAGRERVVALSVVRPRTLRAWTVVGAVAVVAVLVPQVPSWLPVSAPAVAPETLRQRVLASTDRPYQGYAEVDGHLQLPELPNLRDLTTLLTSSTRIRTWYADRSRWRFAVVSPVGERDVYSTPDGEFTWDYGANQLTRLLGDVPVRVPRAGDFTPPELARRV